MSRRIALLAASVSSVLACVDGNEPPLCEETLLPETRCCDGSLYTLASVTDLATRPFDFLGTRIETEGMADWAPEASGVPGCDCVGMVCSCVVPLALKSEVCPAAVALTGIYRSRPVECSQVGCWPLNILSRYGVCGTVTQSGSTFEISLELESFCPR